MTLKRPDTRWLLMAIVAIVNAMFTYKYGVRIVPPTMAVAVSVMVGVGFFAVEYLIMRSKAQFWQRSTLLYIFLGAIVVAMLAIMCVIDRETNSVDRWSAIHNFLEYMLDGRYPYAAPTHLGGYGSPFPAWQIWHLPYYLLGNVGYSSIVCLLLFTGSLRRLLGTETTFKSVAVLALCLPFWYEVTVVSDLMPNMLLVAAFICWFQKEHDNEHGKWFLPICAAICGLFLSTRLATFIPLAIAMFPTWNGQSITNKVALPLIAIVIFALTFLPFALWDGNMLFHFEYNPFSLQTRQGSPIDTILMIGMIIFFALRSKQTSCFTATALTLFLFIAEVFAHRLLASEDALDFWGSNFDHTYLAMCIPFALVSIYRTR